MKKPKNKNKTALDLFSGAGGLTLGLKNAGFNVVGAVELDERARATYVANHPEVRCLLKGVEELDENDLASFSKNERIDLIAGCPPCQGFSSLTSKWRRDDPRNRLVIEMARVIEKTMPLAIMMENVPGLVNKGKYLFEEFLSILKTLGYKSNYDILQVADFGVPQTRLRLVLVAGLGFDILLPERTHSKNGKEGLLPWRTLQDTITGLPTPLSLEQARNAGGPQRYNWHIVRNLSPQNKMRLQMASPGKSNLDLPENIRANCHKSGKAGFSNTYGRLSWDQPSVTITGGCTTLSKGRFGHPEEDRTLSVREAALLQTFPLAYFFDTDYMEVVCNQIGNALPCMFAEAVARKVFDGLLVEDGRLA
ncbi:MAG: DNA cytosine methyltransferase [Deltaproteobacteria bacterium]|nr:DNA cytosine methyltransferase [Deltaproteobacteria bacterium]